MRALLILFAVLLPAAAYPQTPPRIDFLQVAPGKPFPLPPLMAAVPREGSLPFYTITVPMPDASALHVFPEYDVDAMFDNGAVYSLHAKRTFDSTEGCAGALQSLVSPLTKAYALKGARSRPMQFQASTGDIVVEASCTYAQGSPYPTLSLYVTSKAEKQRVSAQIRKTFGGAN
jgi:hypothetical protein